MTDEDVIAKVAALLGKNYFSLSRRTSSGKMVYKVAVSDRATLLILLPRLLPYMGARRRERIEACLELLTAWQTWRQERERRGREKKKDR